MANILTLKERILAFLEKTGIRKVDFFESTGIQSSNFKGANIKSAPGGDMLVKILTKYPSLSAEWLMRGEGEMLRNCANSDTTQEEQQNKTTPSDQDQWSGFGEIIDKYILTIKDQAQEIGRLQERIHILESKKTTN